MVCRCFLVSYFLSPFPPSSLTIEIMHPLNLITALPNPSPCLAGPLTYNDTDSKLLVHEDGKTVTLDTTFENYMAAKEKVYSFDRVIGGEGTQKDVYEVVHPLVESVVQGYNATVFAYGVTGTVLLIGKSNNSWQLFIQ